MAEVIPDRMPSGASRGEKQLFEILQRLPDDYLVYYEPFIDGRHPDFLVICPDLGLMVIEVKGWYPAEIRAADSNQVLVARRQLETREKHPLRQAREYMFRLMDFCRTHEGFEVLLHRSGAHQNRFVFPFGHFAVLSNITSEQLSGHELGDLTPIFPANRVVPRDTFLSWKDLDENELRETFRSFFDPSWSFPPLTAGQVNTLRAIIHPEIRIDAKPKIATQQEPGAVTPDVQIAVLDLRQEKHARSLGEGHRLIYGIAGSGKTVLLIARARLLAEQDPRPKVLFLCFNVALAAFVRSRLADCPSVRVLHFDGWAKQNGVIRRPQENNASLGQRLLERLESGHGDYRKYHTVLIDEAQDFDPQWFRCVLATMEDPLDGNLIVVGDASQGLYRQTGVSWKSLGIQAAGRTFSRKFDLDKNYRNSREILELARSFATASTENDEEGMLCIPVDPACAQRATGYLPRLICAPNRDAESRRVIEVARGLLQGRWNNMDLSAPLKGGEIGILYPRLPKWLRTDFDRLRERLGELDQVVWLSDPEHRGNRKRIGEPAIKIQTIHTAKGLQYKAVILMWADLLPAEFDDQSEPADRCLMYVAMTRPEDFLLVTCSGMSKFVDEIRRSGKVEVG